MSLLLNPHVKDIVHQFDYTDTDVNNAVKEFLRQMAEGLERDGTSLSQIPTYVTAVPNGTEKGLYMAVDLGGTNFRVCSIKLNGDGSFYLTSSKVEIPKELMVAKTAQELFAFLARQIALFLEKHHTDRFEAHVRRRMTASSPLGFRDESVFRMGFTFSFPVRQVGVNRGTLIRWTKGFDIPDAVGKDVCALLQAEIDKLHLPVKITALVNDTVGTLMARSYSAPGKHGAVLGAIFGTGTNGAYVEQLSKVKKPLVGDYDASTGLMVINTEWGSFDNELSVLPNTPWDIALDKLTPNPGLQMYEKRVSGMFLGEVMRQVLLDILKNPNIPLFKDVDSRSNDWTSVTEVRETSPIFQPWGIDTKSLSVAAGDNMPPLPLLRGELESLDINSPSFEDAQVFKAIAEAIVRRAARLSAVAIAAIVLQTGKLTDPDLADEPVDIGVDGSLVEHYPCFTDMIYEALRAVDGIGEEGAKRIRIGIAKDGSGVGAALIALVAGRMETANEAAGISELRSTVNTVDDPENERAVSESD
ncbi:hypothetical protein C8A03DRAFT_32190 [Achaetomium macrosporum]|uniref:Phosphotransferase n=1 Tax=Achaetomium macrosporum TaxID=79813 RepID=A0AAN7CEB9_9PEZI|nr:hypothetical protein C8A03DRAFT_32190 [Achaetomium macrosporum]